MKEFIKDNKQIIKVITILAILFLLVLYVVLNLLASRAIYIARPPYDKSRFIHVEEFNEDDVLTLSNERFTLDLNVSDTKFSLEDKKTNKVWLSNPEKISTVYPKELNDMFVVYYERQLETPKSISVFEKSVNNDDYYFHSNDDMIEILYEIGRDDSLTMLDFPKRVHKDKYEEKILKPLNLLLDKGEISSRHFSFLRQNFIFMEEENLYFLKDVTSKDGLEILYDLIFVKSDYTYDDLVADSKEYNFPLEQQIPYFEFVVRYQLDDDGLRVRIINESIYETEEYPMAYIDVLPYFGATNVGDKGQTIIPDGSGVVINHDNGKYSYPNYDKRIYGRDSSIGRHNEVLSQREETIKMPMYGYINNNDGFINVLEESDAMSSIRAGFRTSGGVGSYSNVIPWINYRYMLRERDSYTFSTWYMTQRVSIWTKEFNQEDYASKYIFGEETKTYYDISKLYQNYLVKKHNLKKLESENVMHISILGGYKKKKHFLGFPYDSIKTLTTPKELLKIANEIDNTKGSVDISYIGWSNEGVKPTNMKKIKYNRNIATKKELKKLVSEVEAINNNLFLEINTQTAYSDKNVRVKKDVVRNIFQKPIMFYDFDQATQLANRETTPQYYLKTNNQNKIYKTINKLNDFDNIVLSDEARNLATEFSNKDIVFRNHIKKNTIQNLSNINKNIILRNSNIYASMLTNKIIDVSNTGTINRIVDYDIPLIQLVYNGYINYSAPSANLDTSKSLKWHRLKALETGSRMQFTLSYQDTVNLLKTEYSKYYSTYYENWLEEINDILTIFEIYGIYDEEITSHRTLNSQGTKVEVTYSNGKVFTINYDHETVLEGRV